MTEGEIDYNIVPGTTILVDATGALQAEHAKGTKDIILIPTPSEDPNDPLNWTRARKYLCAFCMVVYTFGIGVNTAAIYSVLTDVSEATGISVAALNEGTGYMFLFLGIGNFFFQPLARQYGKRPVYLFSMFATCLVSVWAPFVKARSHQIADRILIGFFSSPIESLCEITITDIFFEHERATWLGIYGLALVTSNFLAPVFAGLITQGIGYKWVFNLCCIWMAVCFVFLFFFFEETNYDRKLSPKIIDAAAVDSDSIELNGSEAVVIDEEKKLDTYKSPDINQIISQQTNQNYTTQTIQYSSKVKTWREKLSLTAGFGEKNLFWHFFLGPFKMVVFPSVLWSGFCYGSSLVWFTVLNATSATILSAEPYHFNSSLRGVAYMSPFIFSCLCYFVAGYLSDKLKIYIARKRGGVSYAEDRLWVMALYSVLGALAAFGWGLSAYFDQNWFLLIICFGVLGGLGVIGATGTVTYTSDCYHELDSEAMVIVIIIRNVMSFAVSYGIGPWIDNLGLKKTFISVGFICLFCQGSFIIMRYTGPYWRNKTKGLYWRMVENDRRVRNGH
ncbi:hypothetical protein WICPIJ_001975 [Wickerhamomyces pijperi]|uniref:Major facilitator superfamily (MFS) profile domain-containing protein n=1 Tax=Wickerhamomyces pijperi TaxID=599730 RepID=A0A9P8TQ26_WICPI|nr:hypothetical protein WICPIJ_001975 [Wickerhamomyces pijperi]